MRKLLLPLLLLTTALCSAQEAEVTSPDGQLVVRMGTENGRAYYTVTCAGMTVLQPSRLGFTANYGDFSEGLKL